MRKTLFVFLIVLVSVAWAAAQQSSRPGNMGGQGTPGAGGRAMGSQNNGQSTSPGAMPEHQADQRATAASQVIEGCLGGAAPDFTVTDKAGTVYKLGIPKDSDSSQLTAHVGQSVRVQGVVNDKGTSGSSAAGSSGKSPVIAVEQMARGTGSCPVAPTPKKK